MRGKWIGQVRGLKVEVERRGGNEERGWYSRKRVEDWGWTVGVGMKGRGCERGWVGGLRVKECEMREEGGWDGGVVRSRMAEGGWRWKERSG